MVLRAVVTAATRTGAVVLKAAITRASASACPVIVIETAGVVESI